MRDLTEKLINEYYDEDDDDSREKAIESVKEDHPRSEFIRSDWVIDDVDKDYKNAGEFIDKELGEDWIASFIEDVGEDEYKEERTWTAGAFVKEYVGDDDTIDEILESNYKDEYDDWIQEEFEDEISDVQSDITSGEDPDGFYGWDDYYHWKNG